MADALGYIHLEVKERSIAGEIRRRWTPVLSWRAWWALYSLWAWRALWTYGAFRSDRALFADRTGFSDGALLANWSLFTGLALWAWFSLRACLPLGSSGWSRADEASIGGCTSASEPKRVNVCRLKGD